MEKTKLIIQKKIVLATGMSNFEPNLHTIKQAFLEGLMRHCMVCDAYEVENKHVAIVGWGQKVIKETLFLLTYTNKITLFTLGRDLHLKLEQKNYLKDIK